MSKQSSEVAFIPDNISNISSEKQRNHEDTSHKIQQSYISKLTKLQTDKLDAVQSHEANQNQQTQKQNNSQNTNLHTDIQSPAKVRFMTESLRENPIAKEDALPKNNIDIKGKIVPQKKLIIHRFTRQVQDPYHYNSASFSQKKQVQNDNTFLYGKRTQTDVISQKQSFIEEQEDYLYQKNQKINKNNFLQNQKDSLNDDQMNKYSRRINKLGDGSTQEQIMHITQIDKYDEVQTEIGWLQHCINSNYKFLYSQTNDLFNFNKASLIELQKIQLRAKIIQLQIDTNKLKIALRKKQSSKHINFSLDLKFNRKSYLKIPKKVDQQLRKYCQKLEGTVTRLKKQQEENNKQLSLLQFYYGQFSKKINYAYIYQEYLIKKARQQLGKDIKQQNKRNLRKSNTQTIYNSSNNLNKTAKLKSLQNHHKNYNQLTQLQLSKEMSTRHQISKHNINGQIRQSSSNGAISLSERLKQDESLRQYQTPKKHQNYVQASNTMTDHKKKNTMRFIQKGNISLNNLQDTRQIQGLKLPLTHHKQLSQPLKDKYVRLVNSAQKLPKQKGLKTINFGAQQPKQKQVNNLIYGIPLFNSPHRQKKHFYYQCQLYLRQLQSNYLFNCEQQKQNSLLRNEKGFRQRQFLRMKIENRKNQILDTEVDMNKRQKQLNRQNQILKKQLKMLESLLQSKFSNHNNIGTNQMSINRKTYGNKKSILNYNKYKFTSPENKIYHKSPQNYESLYKQAEQRLIKIKSATLLEGISKAETHKNFTKHKMVNRNSLQEDFEQNYITKNKNKMTSKSKQKDRENLSNKFLSRFKVKSFRNQDQQLTGFKSENKSKSIESNKNLVQNRTQAYNSTKNQTIQKLESQYYSLAT